MPLAVRAGLLIDGTGRDPMRDVLILIEDHRFKVVARAADASVPEGYDLLDASHFTVLPGLIDAHVHLGGTGDPSDQSFGPGASVTRSIPTVALNYLKNALKSFAAGYTTLRTCADRFYADVAVRDAIDRGDFVGPRLWCAGQGITSTNGHMDWEKNLAPHVHLDGPTTIADSPDEARRAVRLNLRFNVDFIKTNITISENVRRYGGLCAPEMTKETMAAMIDEAHWHGRKVTAHCHGGAGVTWALEAGIDGLEHGYWISDEQFETMARNGTFLCPTLTVNGRFREHAHDGTLQSNDPDLPRWRDKSVAAAWDTVNRAKGHGVRIVAGTDASVPYCRHGSNAYEMEMLVEAGLTSMEAIVASTGGSAEAIGIPEVGTVEPGNWADLVLVDGDPLQDIRCLQDLNRIQAVIKEGFLAVDRRPRSAT